MSKIVQYWGTANYDERPITGVMRLWTTKMRQEVPDDVAAKLVATEAGFQYDSENSSGEPVTYSVNPITGRTVEYIGGFLSARGVDTVRSNRVVLFGSSTTYQGLGGPTDIYKMVHGYFNWANALLGNRFQVVKNAGVDGDVMSNMLTRFATDVAAYQPGWVFFQSGNDIFGNGTDPGISASSAFAMAVKLIEMSKSIGANVHILLPWPRGSSNATVTPATLSEHFKFVAMLKQYARTQYGVVVTDANEVIVDYTSATGNAITDMLQSDVTHLTGKGAQVVGMAVAKNIAALAPYVPWRVGSPAETYGSNSAMPVIFDSPFMTSTNAAGNGAGASGTVMFGAVSGRVAGSGLTIVNSIVDCSAIPYPSNSLIPPCALGKAQKASMTAAGAGDRWNLTIPLTASRLAITDVIEGRVGIVVRNAVNLRSIYAYLSFNSSAVILADLYRQSTTQNASANPIDKPFAIADFHAELCTPQRLLSDLMASVTDVSLIVAAVFEATGSADVYVYQPVPRKVLSS